MGLLVSVLLPLCAAAATLTTTVAPAGITAPSALCASVTVAVELPAVADTPLMESPLMPVVASEKWEAATPLASVLELVSVRVVEALPKLTVSVAPSKFETVSAAGLDDSVVTV